jgi:hypothetical protein
MESNRQLQTTAPEWLAGAWESKTASGIIYEEWKKVNSNTFTGRSYMLRDRDTIVLENIQLITKDNVLTYIPTVKGENNDQPVIFPLISRSAKKIVFENKSHDFPQVISYTRISKDSLLAETSGTSRGVIRRQSFPMRRISTKF